MATKSELAFGPAAMTEGYSINGSQAKSVAWNPGGSFKGGKRFSVAGPERGPSPARPANALARTSKAIARNKRRVTADVSGKRRAHETQPDNRVMLPRTCGHGYAFSQPQ